MNFTIGSIRIRAKNAINSSKNKATFLSVGKINAIKPKINPVTAIAKSTVAKIVSAVILLNFNVNNCFF